MPTAEIYSHIFREYNELKTERANFDIQWQQIADYGLGQRDFTTHPFVQGRGRQTLVYNGAFEQAGDDLAAALVLLTINPYSRWAWLEDPDPRVMEQPGVAQHYELETEQLYRVLADPRSGFYTSAHESFFEYSFFGNMGSYCDTHVDDGRIQFQSLPLSDCFVAEDGYGYPTVMYLRRRLRAYQAYELWGEAAGKQVVAAAKGSRTHALFEFVQCIMPNKRAILLPLQLTPMAYLSVTFNADSKEIIETKGYRERPFQFARASKDPGETYGRGPGQKALADCKMINRMSRTLLVSAEKAADPPLMVADDGVIGHPTTEPNGIMVVRNTGTNQPPAQYLLNQSRLDLPQERFQDTKQAIRARFFADAIEVLQDPRLNIPQTLEAQSRIVRRMGPMAMRIQGEWAEPLVQRAYALARRAGLMPPRPEILEGRPVRLVYISPAARAQMSADAQAILGFTGALAEWSQVDQDVLDNADFDMAANELARFYGNLGKIVRRPVDVETIRRAKDEAAAAQAQMQQAAQVAAMAAGQVPQQPAA